MKPKTTERGTSNRADIPLRIFSVSRSRREESLTDTLAQFLSAQYVVAAKAAVRQTGGVAVDLKTLQGLCNDVAALRRGDQNAEWLRLEREKFAEAKQDDQCKALEWCLDAAKQWPDVDKLFRAAFMKLDEREEGKS